MNEGCSRCNDIHNDHPAKVGDIYVKGDQRVVLTVMLTKPHITFYNSVIISGNGLGNGLFKIYPICLGCMSETLLKNNYVKEESE